MEELPFNRIRRLKKANLGMTWPFSRAWSSTDGSVGDEGRRFIIR